MRVLISGAGGNLGQKLSARLAGRDWCETILGIDQAPFMPGPKVRPIVADLRDAGDSRWHAAVAEADAVVHFAAENPDPVASWGEAARSFDMTANLLEHAGRRSCRFVFASSNHVMGGYKDAELPAGGKLDGDTPPLPGTRIEDGGGTATPVAYGASKLFGERAAFARAAATGGGLTAVVVRIGWCQPGENLARTLNSRGMPSPEGSAAGGPSGDASALRWFRNMWLSNRDFADLFERAVAAPTDTWPGPAVLVNGMSDNRGMAWDLAGGKTWLSYRPQDDVWNALGGAPA